MHIALLPPLADARLIPLPPLRHAEIKAVLQRDVSRYFLAGSGPQVVAFRPRKGARGPTRAGGSPEVLAAAAPHFLIETLRTSILQAGWRLKTMQAAHGAWLTAAETASGPPVDAVVAIVDSTPHILRLSGSDPISVRQLPIVDAAEVAKALGPGPGHALLLASPDTADGLAAALTGAGWIASRDPAGWASAEEGAAARSRARVLELVPPSVAAERESRIGRSAGWLAAASVALLVAAAGAQLWGVQRELDGVLAQRAAIQGQVEPLLATRDSLNRLSDRVRATEELSRGTTRWLPALVDLTAILPRDTYLTSLYASGDTVEFEAAGSRAGEAIQALREAGLFDEVRLDGIVERELRGGEVVVERFSVRARLTRGDGAQPAGSGGL